MTSSFSPLPKLTFSWPSMPCMLVLVPTKSATMVFGPLRGRPDCCVHRWRSLAQSSAVQEFGHCPLPHSLLALTSSFSAPVEIVFFTRPVLGALVKVSLSPSRLPFCTSFSQVPLLVLSSLLRILLPSSSSTLHSVAGVATFSDGPALPPLLHFTWHW